MSGTPSSLHRPDKNGITMNNKKNDRLSTPQRDYLKEIDLIINDISDGRGSRRLDWSVEDSMEAIIGGNADKINCANPYLTFNNIIEGENNFFALAAAKHVSKAIGSHLNHYNPLLIYGNTGSGKTHILHAIWNAVLKVTPNLSVLFRTADQLMHDVVFAIRHDKIANFRNQYENVGMLIVDDIDYLSKAKATCQELLLCMDILLEKERQIVFTSRLSPNKLEFPEALKSRLIQGLATDIQPYSMETKVAIVKKKADDFNVKLPPDVVNWIASKCSNIRIMEGCIIRLSAYATIMDIPIDIKNARKALNNWF